MTSPSEALTDLARAYQVATEFTDWRGRRTEVSAETIAAVLSALGVDVTDPAAAIEARELEWWRRMLPPCLVTIKGEAGTFPVHVPHGDPVEVTIELETGGAQAVSQADHWVEPREVDGTQVGEATFEVPTDLPLGYHTIHATSDGRTATCTLIVTPRWLGLPEGADAGRSWGFATQLYSVLSQGSWGVGDLADLADLAAWSAELGADYVLVNPLHAAEPVPPMEPSPYLPSSRRFFNPLYLRPEQVPEHDRQPAGPRDWIDYRIDHVHRPEGADDVIDRDAAWSAKRDALHMMFLGMHNEARDREYAAYLEREGDALRDFAVWSVLAEDHGSDAREWPDGLRDPSGVDVTRYAAEHKSRVDFACWLQFVLDEQLEATQARARAAGMRLGVIHDLAVGVHPGGADVWRLPDVYGVGITVGAPPDPFNQLGQVWSQPPWRPDRLAELAYQPFRDVIAAVLRHAGGVRVDHILGLFRLWWIPEGRPANEGTYVYYDHEALIGVLALEAHRAAAVVIGEDLGVVAPHVRDYLRSRGVFGTSLLWFERDGDGNPLPAEQWREWCLASVTTHDLPPTAGYLAGEHVRLQHRLGLLEGDLDEQQAAAAAERESWLEELRRRGLSTADTDESVVALHRYLTLTPARLLCVALTDAVGDRRTQNQPGTIDEYPNWRVPLSGPDGLPMTLEEVFTARRPATLAAALNDTQQ